MTGDVVLDFEDVVLEVEFFDDKVLDLEDDVLDILYNIEGVLDVEDLVRDVEDRGRCSRCRRPRS